MLLVQFIKVVASKSDLLPVPFVQRVCVCVCVCVRVRACVCVETKGQSSKGEFVCAN
jgi:hypothetical protein